ncbi:tripartite tricarboxylate transporter permease [Stappia indica]|uniref:tripartite tricarboxylate transporter permease n=1 Tax=Stappia indica TaxID=538381 RepID=UPI001D188B44|nr:tripartite tricarboxylate transporter permease [Stappia indica]MCC4245239.1 tripartite tricarboxylate transporter permease [Stappia indica]
MELFTLGFASLTLTSVVYCFAGVFLGTLIGVLPGVGALSAISLLMPVSFYLDPTTALVFLSGIYYGAEYGGSTASIMLNLPGTSSNAITCLDGYPMAQNGKAGVALTVTTYVSFFGGTVGILLLSFLSPLISRLAVAVGPSEYAAILLLSIIMAATISDGPPMKGIAMVLLGALLGTVGIDVNSGDYRFTFGIPDLFDGVSLVALALGTFGIGEVIFAIRAQKARGPMPKVTFRSMIPSRPEFLKTLFPMVRGTGVGSVVGPLPGAGPTIASLIGYAIEKRISRTPHRFGKGAIEGISSPEAANNAAVQTAFIPTLSLGIPGSPTMAIMLGALMIHGISPGPKFIAEQPEMFWGLIASFWLGNIILLGLNLPLVGIWLWLLRIPYSMMYPVIVALICAGVFTLTNSAFAVWLVLGFGFVGFLLRLFDYSPAPLLIGFILGPMLEENLRRALLIHRGSYIDMLSRPATAVLMLLTVAILLWAILKRNSSVQADDGHGA